MKNSESQEVEEVAKNQDQGAQAVGFVEEIIMEWVDLKNRQLLVAKELMIWAQKFILATYLDVEKFSKIHPLSANT